MQIIMLPTANTMHQEKIISFELLSDNKCAKIKTEVLNGSCKGDIRNYPEYPVNELSLRIERN